MALVLVFAFSNTILEQIERGGLRGWGGSAASFGRVLHKSFIALY